MDNSGDLRRENRRGKTRFLSTSSWLMSLRKSCREGEVAYLSRIPYLEKRTNSILYNYLPFGIFEFSTLFIILLLAYDVGLRQSILYWAYFTHVLLTKEFCFLVHRLCIRGAGVKGALARLVILTFPASG